MSEAEILVVEDEAVISKHIETLLEDMGYKVSGVCGSGKESFIEAGELKPDLVLMDIWLEGKMNGTAAAKKIWSNYRIPVVYLTAHSEHSTVENAKSGGTYGYLTKPIDETELRNTLKLALSKHEMEEKLLKKEREVYQHKVKQERNKRLAALGKMAAGITHDIKNFNSAIKSNLDFLTKIRDKLEEYFEEHDPADSELANLLEKFPPTLEAIRRATEKIEEIEDKTSTYSQARSTPSEGMIFNPIEKIEYFFKYFEEIFSKNKFRNVEVKLNLDTKNVSLRGDSGEFDQVLKNLLENAAEAVHDKTEGWIELNVFCSGGEFCLTVEDNGSGISEAEQERIFDPLYSGRASGEGLGLGLSIVKGIVEKMNGKIKVSSQLGEGTKFKLCFPRVKTKN